VARRARPRRERASSPDANDTTRERILHAALGVFAESGYAGCSIREVCKRANVNSAALNYHWGSKERLWQAVCQYCSEHAMKVAGGGLDFALPARQLVPQLLGRMFDALVLDPGMARIPLWAFLQADALDFTTTSSSLLEPLASILVMFATQAQAKGEIPASIDLPVVVPLLYGQFLFAFADPAGHRHLYGTDYSNPEHAARVRRAFVATACRTLGWDPDAPDGVLALSPR
jgi:AcrR family transcriptional regulator